MTPLEKLAKWFQRRPLVLLRFSPGDAQAFQESRLGLNRFTWAVSHSLCEELKLPTVCICEMQEHRGSSSFYVGVVLRKAAITTIDSRLTAIDLQRLRLDSLDELRESLLGKRFRNAFDQIVKIDVSASAFTPRLSVAILAGC